MTQYDNLSLEQVNEYIEQSSDFKKIDDIYISDDFKTYYKIYLINGLPTVEWRELNLNELSVSLKSKVSKKIQEKENQIRTDKIIEEERQKQEERITSKIYNLKDFPEDKDFFIKQLHRKIINSLRHQIAGKKVRYFAFKKDFFEIILNDDDELVINKNSNKYSNILGIYDISFSQNKNKKISIDVKSKLTNDKLNFYKLLSSQKIKFPIIKVQDYQVNQLKFNIIDFKIDYKIGYQIIKIKNGQIKFKGKEILSDSEKESIKENINFQINGEQLIIFEIYNIGGQQKTNIAFVKGVYQ